MKDIFPITIDIRRNPYFLPRLIGYCGDCLSVNQSNHAADVEKKNIYVVVNLLILIEYIYLMMAKRQFVNVVGHVE